MLKTLKYHWLLVYLLVIIWLIFLSEGILIILMIGLFLIWRLYQCHSSIIFLLVGLLVIVFFSFSRQEENFTIRQQMDTDHSRIQLRINPDMLIRTDDRIRGEAMWQTKQGDVPVILNAELTTDETLNFLPGIDAEINVIAEGKIDRIKPAKNFGVFDYAEYLANKGIFYSIQIEKILQVKPSSGWRSFLNSWRYRIKLPLRNYENMWVNLHNRVMFQMKSDELKPFNEIVAMLGIVHLFSISGIQVSWLRYRGNWLLRRCGIQIDHGQWIIEILLFLYAWLIYFPVGMLRALMTFNVKVLVRYFDLPLSSMDVIAIIGMFLIICHPIYLYSLGYQLSFGLTIAIRLLIHHQPRLSFLSQNKQQMIISIFCTLIVWPITMRMNHEWYPLQLFSNSLIGIFFIDLFYLLLVMTTLLIYLPFPHKTFLFKFLSMPITWLAESSVVNSIFQRFSFVTGELSLFSLVILLIVPFFFLFFNRKKLKHLIAVSLIFYISVLFLIPLCDWRGKITLLYVGQGDALLVRFPFGQGDWLIDTGGRMNWHDEENMVSNDEADRYLLPALKSQGINKLQGVILTHADIDHMGNFLRLAQEVPIEHLYINQMTKEDTLFQEMLAQHSTFQSKMTIHIVPYNQRVTVKEVIGMYTIAPNSLIMEDSLTNQTSIINDISLYGFKLLTLGDVSIYEERQLLSYFNQLPVQVLKLAHHGSKTSTSSEMLQTIAPHLALISAGEANHYGHPHREVTDLLHETKISYLSTSEVGAIQIIVYPNGNFKVRFKNG